MRKIIIQYPDNMPEITAMQRVEAVMMQGKISDGKFGPQFCFLSTFSDDSIVVAREKKTNTTDSFFIRIDR